MFQIMNNLKKSFSLIVLSVAVTREVYGLKSATEIKPKKVWPNRLWTISHTTDDFSYATASANGVQVLDETAITTTPLQVDHFGLPGAKIILTRPVLASDFYYLAKTDNIYGDRLRTYDLDDDVERLPIRCRAETNG